MRASPRIYTRNGDQGMTALADGSLVRKDHPRVCAVGSVDECNALLGLLACEALPDHMSDLLHAISHDLFDLGSDLMMPLGQPGEQRIPRISPQQVASLEAAIDRWDASLPPLSAFILPGGSRSASLLHQARTIARRAEREAWACQEALVQEQLPTLNLQALIYLNRLSDLLFVCARVCNLNGGGDVLWQPGRNR